MHEVDPDRALSLMDDPWRNAWTEKEPVQELAVKPREDTWLTSPASITSPTSGDIGVAWTTEWAVPSTKSTTLHDSTSVFPSTSAPWESVLGTAGDSLSPGFETQIESTREYVKDEEQTKEREEEGEHRPLSPVRVTFEDTPPVPSLPTRLEDPISRDDNEPVTTSFENTDIDDGAWKSLSQAAVIVGDEAAWDSAWRPPADELEECTQSPKTPVDEWSRAVEEKAIRDTRVPPEVMEMILGRFNELSGKIWPDEDLASARSRPAPRDEWQGGLENVEGLTSLVNEYLPPPPTAPPIRFASTQIATSFQTAMKLTRSYGLVQSSPLSRLIKTPDTWEASARRDKPFSLEAWLLKHSKAPLSPSSLNQDIQKQGKPIGVMGLLGRSSLERGSPSSSPAPRVVQEMSAKVTSTSTTLVSPSPASGGSIASPTVTPAPASAQSAVSRFLNRWSRRVDDAPKPPATVDLRSDELDFLDMIPAMNGPTAEAIKKELGDAAAYPGTQDTASGGAFGNPMSSSTGRSLDSSGKGKSPLHTTNLSQLTSEDFESLLDAQIAEVEDLRMRESLIATSLISEPTDSSYSRLGSSLFGIKKIATAQPLKESETHTSNSLFDDDDDFTGFLGTPGKEQSKPMAPTNYGTPPTVQQAFSPTLVPAGNVKNTPPVHQRASPKVSPTPTRHSTIAIMSQGSRPSTPSVVAPAPLLPPPPGRTASANLFNGDSLISPPSQMALSAAKPATGATNDLDSLLDFGSPDPSMPSAAPKPSLAPKASLSTTASTHTGGLSAQDLSFFEGL